ncbi:MULTISPECIES: hypothetical protein [Paenibacillus]|uniref:Uncharacterized protein n=1 Tax=Paenibacillus azoreducens TaxID=116718 RepID=A0A919YBX4_9BACL|nr:MULTISPECIES: hypothetical protein [Paenibacillus]MBE9912927.1 hypothetical protein [Paenibacillus donghaensis]GIO47609.1 hypothetical protein J34TS1_23740 [Paenibacillus azoreducens]
MNTSSFISGVLIGAAATALMSRNKGAISSAITHNASKMMDIGSIGSIATGGTNYSAAPQNNAHSKADSMKQIHDFINSNPDVKKEVNMILNETNSSIPGL